MVRGMTWEPSRCVVRRGVCGPNSLPEKRTTRPFHPQNTPPPHPPSPIPHGHRGCLAVLTPPCKFGPFPTFFFMTQASLIGRSKFPPTKQITEVIFFSRLEQGHLVIYSPEFGPRPAGGGSTPPPRSAVKKGPPSPRLCLDPLPPLLVCVCRWVQDGSAILSTRPSAPFFVPLTLHPPHRPSPLASNRHHPQSFSWIRLHGDRRLPSFQNSDHLVVLTQK